LEDRPAPADDLEPVMFQRHQFNRRHSSVALAIFTACLTATLVVHAGDPAADAARTRAEIERKGREIKKKVEDHRRDAEARQKEVRDRLNLPAPGATEASASGAMPNLPAARSLAEQGAASTTDRKPWPGMTRSLIAYSPKRRQDYAFRVEMASADGPRRKQWVGTIYFAGIYSDLRSGSGEMFCIGRLDCSARSSAEAAWSAIPDEAISFPQHFRFCSMGVLNAETASLFQKHTLPLQLSAILPLEELIFPPIPMFSDGRHNETRGPDTFYLRQSEKNLLGMQTTTTLNGQSHRLCRVEQENSSAPKLVNERSFLCPSQNIGLSYKQVGTFDAKDGMVVNADLDYLLEMQDDVRLLARIRRLYGNDLAAARDAALQRLPVSEWPAYFKRIPAEPDQFEIGFVRSSSEVQNGECVSVAVDYSDRNSRGSRCYLARSLGAGQGDKLRVRLNGSNEDVEAHHTSVHRARRT
jgi:hypothetical protein